MIFTKIFKLPDYFEESWYSPYDPIPISYWFLTLERDFTSKATVAPSIEKNNSVPLFFKQFGKNLKGKSY